MATITKESLVETLLACQQACNHCFYACLEEDDVKMMAACIRLDRECADICSITLDFLQRESNILPEILEACIKSCEACADECEKHDHDHCQQCAKACRECADACRNYLNQL